ncbi:hypothetical protein MBLNU459_g1810t2 [Dothideomycetes sp. NU459]
MSPQTQTTRRRSDWRNRLSLINRKQEPGVVLHAVPPATTSSLPRMTNLELVMSTSLDEDIFKAVGSDGSPADWASQSPVSRKDSVQSPREAYGQKTTDSRIGVWRNGVADWDVQRKRSSVIEVAGLYFPMPEAPPVPPPKKPLPALPHTSATGRPNLSVAIPGQVAKPFTESKPMQPRHTIAYFPNVAPLFPQFPAASSFPTPWSATDESAVHPAFRTSASSSIQDVPIQYPNVSHGRYDSVSDSIAASRSSMSSSTAFLEENSDRMSCYSRQSSMTSLEEDADEDEFIQNPDWNCLNAPRRSVSAAFSVQSPVKAGVFDDHSPLRTAAEDLLSPTSKATPDQAFDAVHHSQSDVDSPPSPTLSEAVCDLQAQLGSITEDIATGNQVAQSEDGSPTLPASAQILTRAPTVPKKSRKRQWRASSAVLSTTPVPESQASMLLRRQSAPIVKGPERAEGSTQESAALRRISSARSCLTGASSLERSGHHSCSARTSVLIPRIVVDGSSLESSKSTADSNSTWTPAEAQLVLLRIMSGLGSLDDLAATSTINKVQFNESPAAWELREWSTVSFGHVDCDGTSSQSEHTPATYLSCVRRDRQVITELKGMILQRCQSFMRPEAVAALGSSTDVNAQRFDDAFYRIWCFCKIFGSEKGREDDVTGQLDWLKGGLLAHQQDCGATINANLEFDMASVLLNAPEYFAKGNEGGLSAVQLYDMTELWNCLAVLLQGFGGRVEQARACGIFDHCETAVTGMEEEDAALEEWTSHILTLGPSVILELARFSQDQSDAGFRFAKFHGWTEWVPPACGTSRGTFLKEPVTKLYEERLVADMVRDQSEQGEMREVGCQKVASLAAEIKLARTSSTYRRLPLVDVSQTSNVSSAKPVKPVRLAKPAKPTKAGQPSTPTHSRMVAQAQWSPRRISPIIEDRVETFNRLSLLTLDGIADDTSERAIRKIVDMGFTISQAKEALRLTDMGDGLRVDRAVDMLLRQH